MSLSPDQQGPELFQRFYWRLLIDLWFMLGLGAIGLWALFCAAKALGWQSEGEQQLWWATLGLITSLGGAIGWRLFCELIVAVFQNLEQLRAIRDRLENPGRGPPPE